MFSYERKIWLKITNVFGDNNEHLSKDQWTGSSLTQLPLPPIIYMLYESETEAVLNSKAGVQVHSLHYNYCGI